MLAQRGARGDAAALAALRGLLDALCSGGIFDHLGGGLFRYRTDSEWLVPHFEKMLYDNAQFVELLALAHAGAPDPKYRAAAEATVGFMLRELDAAGAFAASLDADTEAGEGAFYVWEESDIDALLGARARPFKAEFDVTAGGNWDGKTILRRNRADAAGHADFAAERAILLAARAGRPRPALDDKVLADWNGLAVTALCRAAFAFDRPDWLRAASARLDEVARRLFRSGRWHHAWRADRISAPGLIDDLAALGNAALSLYEAGGDASRLAQAESIVAEADQWFGPAADGYAMTAADARDIPERLALRPRSAVCSAVPSGSGMMAQLLARLFHLTGELSYRDRARAVIEAFAGRFDQPLACATLLAAAEMLEDGRLVVVAGDAGLPATQALLKAARGTGDPACWVLALPPDRALPGPHPAFGKAAPDGTALAFVCRGATCLAPVGDAADLHALLRR